jgi:hypothetical protein
MFAVEVALVTGNAIVLIRWGRKEKRIAARVVALGAAERSVSTGQREPARGGEVIEDAPSAPGEGVVTAFACCREVLGDMIDSHSADVVHLMARDTVGHQCAVGAAAVVDMATLTRDL